MKKEDLRQQLRDRTRESHERKDDTGKFKSYFRQDLEDISFWKPDKGSHIIDIIPYRAGPNDPHVKEGLGQYVLDLWVHTGVGVNEDQYVCLARNYNRECPICEYQRQMMRQEDYDEGLAKSLYPKRRTIYNIICYDNDKEQDKGVQVWEVAHFFMEKKLVPLAKDRRTGEPISFSDPWEGKSVSWEMVQSSFKDAAGNTRPSWDYTAHRFEERDYDLEGELDNAFCLDELIHVPTYEEVKKAFMGEEEEEEDQDEKGGEVGEPEESEGGEHRGTRHRSASRGGSRSRSSARKEKEATPEGECPFGYRFGEDVNEQKECNECDRWDECAKKSDEIKEQREKEKPTTTTRRRRR